MILRAVEPLIAALQDGSESICESAVKALGKLRDERAIGPLIAALMHEEKDVRCAAAYALQEFVEDVLRRVTRGIGTAFEPEAFVFELQ